MTKELLQYLFEDNVSKFLKDLKSFYLKYLSCHDISKYSFSPALFDSWLASAQQDTKYSLYKLYYPEAQKIIFDLQAYIMVSQEKIYVLNLVNIGNRNPDSSRAIADVAKKYVQPRQKSRVTKESLVEAQLKALKSELNLNINDEKTLGDLEIELLNLKVYAQAAYASFSQEEIKNLLQEQSIDSAGKRVNVIGIAVGVIEKAQRGIEFYDASVDLYDSVKVSNIRHILAPRKLDTNQNVQPQVLTSNQFYETVYKDPNVLPASTATLARIAINNDLINIKDLINTSLRGDILVSDNISDSLSNKLKNMMQAYSLTAKGAKLDEAYLHGSIIGALLANRRAIDITIQSNKESGEGRFDIAIIPKNNNQKTALIIELKHGTSERKLSEELDNVYKQIDNTHYAATLNKYSNIESARNIAIAYCQVDETIIIHSKVQSNIQKIDSNLGASSLFHLLVQGDIAFEHNMQLFCQSVISCHDINKRNPDFVPGLAMGQLLDGISDSTTSARVFYTEKQPYDNFAFLITLDNKHIIYGFHEENEIIRNQHIAEYYHNINISPDVKIHIHYVQLTFDDKKPQIKKYESITIQAPLTVSNTKELVKAPSPINVILQQIYHQAKYDNQLLGYAQSLLNQGKDVFATATPKEAFYHGGMLGLLSNHNNHYTLISNQEMGIGRLDIMVIPRSLDLKIAIVMEFKVTTGTNQNHLTNELDKGFAQIIRQQYQDSSSVYGIAKSIPISISWSVEEVKTRGGVAQLIDHSSASESELHEPQNKRFCSSRDKRNIGGLICIDSNNYKKYGSPESYQKLANELAATADVHSNIKIGNNHLIKTFHNVADKCRTLLLAQGLVAGNTETVIRTAAIIYGIPKLSDLMAETITNFLGTNSNFPTIRAKIGGLISQILNVYELKAAIKEKYTANNTYDLKAADVKITTNALFIILDAWELESVLLGKATRIPGTIGVGVLIAETIAMSIIGVEKVCAEVACSTGDKVEIFFRNLIGRPLPNNIQEKIEIYNIYKNFIQNTYDTLQQNNALDVYVTSLPHIVETSQYNFVKIMCRPQGYYQGLLKSPYKCNSYYLYHPIKFKGVFSSNTCACTLENKHNFTLDSAILSTAYIVSFQDENKFSNKNSYIFKENVACAPHEQDYTKQQISTLPSSTGPTWDCHYHDVDNIKSSIALCHNVLPPDFIGKTVYNIGNNPNL